MQRLVEDAVAAEERDPRDHADDVRGQERHRAEQEQADLEQQAAHVEDQEIGDVEAQHQGHAQTISANLSELA
jgi:hypothetical protein